MNRPYRQKKNLAEELYEGKRGNRMSKVTYYQTATDRIVASIRGGGLDEEGELCDIRESFLKVIEGSDLGVMA